MPTVNPPTLNLPNSPSGSAMPAIGLGTWKSDEGEVAKAVKTSVEIGYRHIDCAPIYGNEAEIGSALAELIAGGKVEREELWITSKLWNACHLRGDVRPALERTLADLQLDYLDLYLMHWPVALKPGTGIPTSADDFLPPEAAPFEETWSAMEDAVDAGLCRYIGLSNFNPVKMRRICEGARIQPVANQVECHPLLAQSALLDAGRELGVVLTGYSPLGSPDRPERVRKDSDPVLLDVPAIGAIASKHAATPAQVILAWAVRRGMSVIPKSVTPARLHENLESTNVPLDDADLAAIAALDRGHRFIDGTFWAREGSPYTLEWLWEN